MFEEKISIFETFDSKPVTLPLDRWVRSTMNPKCKFAQKVRAYRQTGDVELKKGLPLATVGAVCKGGRKMGDVKRRTGWIALDIDASDNKELPGAAAIREAIAQFDFIAFAGLSVSGQGVWALVKIKYPDNQAQHFKKLRDDFAHFGISLDRTKGQNPNDGRFYSFDPDAYVANDFKIYNRLPEGQPIAPHPPRANQNFNYSGDDTRAKVERLISKIDIDITAGYRNWLQLGFALEDEFGESGREYFHAISRYNPDYNQRECDKQYSHCLKHQGSGVGIGTFFHVCRRHRITLNGDSNGTEGQYEADSATGSEPDRKQLANESGLTNKEFNRRFHSYPSPPF